MIKMVKYNGADSLMEVHTRSYDKHGSVIDTYEQPQNYNSQSNYTYDSLNRPLTRVCIDVYADKRKDETEIVTYRYTYVYNGDTLEENERDSESDKCTLMLRNKNNRILVYQEIESYGISFAVTHSYDASGINETECKVEKDGIVNDKLSYRCKYVYDKQGIWIKKTTTSLDGKLRGSIERKIEYY